MKKLILTLLVCLSFNVNVVKAGIADPALAEIIMFAGNFAPRGWAFCDGQLLSIAQNTALFSLLGTTYGGDGRTTFGLPDLRGRVAIHPGNGPGLSSYRLGQKSGSENRTLSVSNMPSHNHVVVEVSTTIPASTNTAGEKIPAADLVLAKPATAIYNDTPNTTLKGPVIPAKTTSNAGGNQSFQIIQPYNTVHFIIALQGVFPSRS